MTAEELRAVNGKTGFPDDRHGKRSSMRPTSLPALAAAFALKQDFGRLIRSAADRGLLALLDKRILKQAYGKIFFDSLPDYTFTTCRQDVEDFFES